jgi:hypothetical protein
LGNSNASCSKRSSQQAAAMIAKADALKSALDLSEAEHAPRREY